MTNCRYKAAEWSRRVLLDILKIPCRKKKEASEGAKYCEEHGCHVCGYANLKWKYQKHSSDEKLKDIQLDPQLGAKSVCSPECQKKANTEHFWKEKEKWDKKEQEQMNLRKKIIELNSQLNDELKKVFSALLNIISRTNLFSLKGQLINEELDMEKFINNCQKTIDCLPFSDEEKEPWKKIYQTNNYSNLQEKLLDLCQQENDYLVKLATKYKDLQEQKNIPECKKCKLRRKQPNTWPAGWENCCQECIECWKKAQTPTNNNDYVPPVNDDTNSPPLDNTPKNNENNSPIDSDQPNQFSPTSDNSPSPQSERGGTNPPTKKHNKAKLATKQATDKAPVYLAVGTVGMGAIIAGGAIFLLKLKLKKKKKTNWHLILVTNKS